MQDTATWPVEWRRDAPQAAAAAETAAAVGWAEEEGAMAEAAGATAEAAETLRGFQPHHPRRVSVVGSQRGVRVQNRRSTPRRGMFGCTWR